MSLCIHWTAQTRQQRHQYPGTLCFSYPLVSTPARSSSQLSLMAAFTPTLLGDYFFQPASTVKLSAPLTASTALHVATSSFDGPASSSGNMDVRSTSISTECIGPFVLGAVLGSGCGGIVRHATHQHTGLEVAVKIVKKPPTAEVSDRWMKLKNEIAVLKMIRHPYVLKLYDLLETSTHLYLVLEHMKGGELFDYIISKGRLSRTVALHIMAQICMGLEHCHAHGICHRSGE
jgi:hypothetical protein